MERLKRHSLTGKNEYFRRKNFVMPLKANRKVALSATDKQHGRYVVKVGKEVPF